MAQHSVKQTNSFINLSMIKAGLGRTSAQHFVKQTNGFTNSYRIRAGLGRTSAQHSVKQTNGFSNSSMIRAGLDKLTIGDDVGLNVQRIHLVQESQGSVVVTGADITWKQARNTIRCE